MNKKLVFICNSPDRLRFMDNYMFKDEFEGEVYILTDDRLNKRKPILENIVANSKVDTLRKAKVLGFIEDGIQDFIFSKISFPSRQSQTDFGKFLFLLTSTSQIFFSQNENDLSLIAEDDVIYFKNPIETIKCLSAVKHCPGHCSQKSNDMNNPNMSLVKEVVEFNRDIIQTTKIDKNLDDIEYYKKYVEMFPISWFSQAHTVFDYDPNFPRILERWIDSESFKKNAKICRDSGQVLYHSGFAIKSERFFSNYLDSREVCDVSDKYITQTKSASIDKAKVIADKDIMAYHYTIIPDEHIFEYLPILIEEGYESYNKAVSNWKRSDDQRKFAYLSDEQMQGWSKSKFLSSEVKPAVQGFDLGI